MNMQNSWFVIGNPNSGKGKVSAFISEIEHFFSQQELELSICEEFEKQSFLRASEGLKKGYRKLLVCGGDGTINQVVNAIFQQNEVASEEVLIAFIPFGTGNDWIKSMGIPTNSAEALQLLIKGKEQKIDIGKLTCMWGTEQKDAYFANIAGFGYDAFVVQEMQKRKDKNKFGKLSYLYAALSLLIQYKPTKMRIEGDNFNYDGPVLSGCVGKGKYNGNGMMQVPHAKLDDGKLAIMLMAGITKLGMLLQTANIYKGTFVNHKKIETFHSEHLKVDSNPPVRVECEGELLGFSPFEFSIKPQSLRVLVP